MPLLSTVNEGALAAKIESVGRNYDTLAQGMEEIQATLAMLAATSAPSAAEYRSIREASHRITKPPRH